MSAIKRIAAFAAAAVMLVSSAAFAAPRYNTKEAELTDFTVKKTYKGSVIYQVSASAALYQPGAIMNEITIQAGDQVNAGDTIATYTAPISDVDIAHAENALARESDDYEYELARRQLVVDEYREAAEKSASPTEKRRNELHAEKAEIELEQYRAEGEARVASFAAQRDAAVTSGDIKYVGAPITGIVAYVRKIDQGADMNGKEIAGFFDPHSLIIRVNNEDGRLKYGMSVDITLEGGKNRVTVPGTVISADNVLPGQQRGGYVYILPDEYPGDILFNSVEVSAVTMYIPDVVVVDNSTVQYANGQSFVQVLDTDGTIRTRYVKVGMVSTNNTWILYGVEPGDKLIAK